MLLQQEEALSKSEMMARLGLKDDKHFRRLYLVPALEQGVIEMTIPDKPRSRNQQYRLTKKENSCTPSTILKTKSNTAF